MLERAESKMGGDFFSNLMRTEGRPHPADYLALSSGDVHGVGRDGYGAWLLGRWQG